MIHLLFRHNILLILLHIILPNKVLTNGTTTLQTQPEVRVQTTTLSRRSILQTLSYIPAQNTQTQIKQPRSTINTLQSNSLPNHTISKKLSRPPLQTIPINPL